MRLLPLIILLATLARPAVAHEWWIEPLAYQPPSGGIIEADLMNGQGFEGLKQVYLPKGIARFVVVSEAGEMPVESRIGDRPALHLDGQGDGLQVVVYQSNYDTVKYAEFAKFLKFVTHKDLGDIAPKHQARGLPDTGFVEAYRRFSKSLVGVGSGVGADRELGLETELVALSNPYVDDLTAGFRVQLLYNGAPRANAQIEMFEKTKGKVVVTTLHRTDANGIAVLPVQRGSSYMLDAVVLREPSVAVATQTGGVWESLWANLTFAVPQ